MNASHNLPPGALPVDIVDPWDWEDDAACRKCQGNGEVRSDAGNWVMCPECKGLGIENCR